MHVLEFNFSRSQKLRVDGAIKPTYRVLSIVNNIDYWTCWTGVSVVYFVVMCKTLIWIFQGLPSSKFMTPNDRQECKTTT